jgi:Tfp pilus assembly protein PilX
MTPRARGFLLLPVMLTLVLVGALAYAMTREAGMNGSGVDAEYDTEAARYLAEAAFNLARWRNSQQGCNGVVKFADTRLYRYNLNSKNVGTAQSDLVGTMKVSSISEVKGNGNKEKGYITIDASSETARDPAGSRRIVRTVPRYDLAGSKLVTTPVTSGLSTTIYTGTPPVDLVNFIELTDGPSPSHGLVRFDLSAIPDKALVKEARLELERKGGEFFFWPLRFLSIHRVTRPWDATTVWDSPAWSQPGGDYAPDYAATSLIADDRIYAWSVDTLAAGWLDGTLPNYGVLLKPSQLVKSRFRAFKSSAGQIPRLILTYYPPCT